MLMVKDIVLSLGKNKILDNIDFCLDSGRILGVIGENGAGKSSLLKILSGIQSKGAGSISFNGLTLEQNRSLWRDLIGFMPEDASFYRDLTVIENIKFRSEINGLVWSHILPEVKKWMEYFHLNDLMNRQIINLSKGEKKRVGLVQICILKKPLIILDEPEDGLDPYQMKLFRDMIQTFKGNHTVIISSHSLLEISKICDEVIFLKSGKMVYSGDANLNHLENLFKC